MSLNFEYIAEILSDYCDMQNDGLVPAANRYPVSNVMEQIALLEGAQLLVDLAAGHRNACILWEQTMMQAVGEDGPSCVVKAIDAIKAERDAYRKLTDSMSALMVQHKKIFTDKELKGAQQHLAAHDAEVGAKAVMGFAEIIRGAYSSGFSPAALTVYDVYQAARNHVFSNYETEAPIWKNDDAEEAKKGINDIQSGAVLGAVKICNHHMAFPVNNGSIADAVIAVDDLTNYAAQLREKAGAA